MVIGILDIISDLFVMRITLGYCSQKDDQQFFEEKITKNCGCDIDIFPMIGYDSICKAYNEVIEESENDLIVLCHNDINILTNNWGIIINDIFDRHEELAIIGNVGSNKFDGEGWLGKNAVALGCLIQNYKLQAKSNSLLIFSPQFINDDYVRSTTIDGMFIAFKKSRIKERFDENIEGFHYYDICFALDNYLKNVVVGVTCKLLIEHNSEGFFNQQWHDLHDGYIKDKYNKILPICVDCVFGGYTIIKKWKNSKMKENIRLLNNIKKSVKEKLFYQKIEKVKQ